MEETVLEIIRRYEDRESKLLPILHAIQDEYGYLPKEAIKIVAKELGKTPGEIYDAASFYSFLYFEERGRHIIRVCNCIVCNMKGSEDIIRVIEENYGIKEGETTKDGAFTLEIVEGLGHCDQAPVMMVDEDIYGNLTPEKALEILRRYEK